jgi:hypothetical protein
MQARFFFSLGMRAIASFSIVMLKHQHSALPWLMPHAFGSPQEGQTLGLISVPIGTTLKLALKPARFERAQSSGALS